MHCDGAIRNIEKEILRECSNKNIPVHENFLNYYVSLNVHKKINICQTFPAQTPLTRPIMGHNRQRYASQKRRPTLYQIRSKKTRKSKHSKHDCTQNAILFHL